MASPCFQRIKAYLDESDDFLVLDLSMYEGEKSMRVSHNKLQGIAIFLIQNTKYWGILISTRIFDNSTSVFKKAHPAFVYHNLLSITTKHKIMLLEDDQCSLGIGVSFRCFEDLTDAQLADEIQSAFERLIKFRMQESNTIAGILSRINR